MAMLAITAALEHFTAIFADDLLRNPEQVKDCPDDIRRLWIWHAMEETEHKGVAFDVLLRATAGWPAWRRYLLRFNVMIVTTIMFNMRIVKIALRLLKADGITGWSAWWRVVKFWFGPQGLMARSGRNYWSWYKPGFHPWSHDNRDLLTRWRPFFDQGAQAAAE
jgi:predicted metal-dependent hydrolase